MSKDGIEGTEAHTEYEGPGTTIFNVQSPRIRGIAGRTNGARSKCIVSIIRKRRRRRRLRLSKFYIPQSITQQ